MDQRVESGHAFVGFSPIGSGFVEFLLYFVVCSLIVQLNGSGQVRYFVYAIAVKPYVGLIVRPLCPFTFNLNSEPNFVHYLPCFFECEE